MVNKCACLHFFAIAWSLAFIKENSSVLFFVCIKNEAIMLFDLNIKRSSGDFIGFLVKASVVVFQAYFHFHHKICV